MQITVCVCDHDVEVPAIGQEFGGDGLDGVGGLAEEVYLVGVLFLFTVIISFEIRERTPISSSTRNIRL